MRPFLRWPGGKQWLADSLADEIKATAPSVYVEPFLGAGAVALALLENGGIKAEQMVLSDWSTALMNTWQMIVKQPRVMASLVREASVGYTNGKEGYLEARRLFNQYPTHGTRAAALMLYLNARSFNGLWRENSKGLYNVPYGDVRSPRMLSSAEAEELARLLKGASIEKADFEPSIAEASEGAAIYADPPYDNQFAAYTASGFDRVNQKRLADCLKRAVERGASMWSTNADTPLIREIYNWAHVDVLMEPRAISAKASSRKKCACVIIRAGKAIKTSEGSSVHGGDDRPS